LSYTRMSAWIYLLPDMKYSTVFLPDCQPLFRRMKSFAGCNHHLCENIP